MEVLVSLSFDFVSFRFCFASFSFGSFASLSIELATEDLVTSQVNRNETEDSRPIPYFNQKLT